MVQPRIQQSAAPTGHRPGEDRPVDLLDAAVRLVAPLCEEAPTDAVAPPGAGLALLALALHRRYDATVLALTDGAHALEALHRDLRALAPESDALCFPDSDIVATPHRSSDLELVGARTDVLLRAQSGGPSVVCASIQALMRKAPAPSFFQSAALTLEVGAEYDLDAITKQIEGQGYDFEPEVVRKGQASLRGGILDVWPSDEPEPLRLEFFGPVLDTARAFDPATQCSTERRAKVTLALPGEWRPEQQGYASLLDFLPPRSIVVEVNPPALDEHAQIHADLARDNGMSAYLMPQDFLRGVARDKGFRQVRLWPEGSADADAGPPLLACEPLELAARAMRADTTPDLMAERRERLASRIAALCAEGYAALFYFDTEGASAHFGEWLAERGLAQAQRRVGALTEGFVWPSARVVVIAEADLHGGIRRQTRGYGKTAARPSRRRSIETGERLADLGDLAPGELVVHIDHGLGRFLGVNEVSFNGQVQEALSIEYEGGARLHVPISHVHLLSRYTGVNRREAPLHRLGGKRWVSDKAEAERAVADLAAGLLETQAERECLQGFAFAPDTPWQRDFEAAFPFRETEDQIRVIEEIKRDMEAARPMDRLVCGDAGYGKTEVAMRAAFKAVMDAKQVAVLVPTTVLAQQHFETFRARMAGYPIRIEMLSRFSAAAQRLSTLRGMAEGGVDIVIGTHALLQDRARFKDLGLAIVDEEQRFGVEHKEKLKRLRRLVDVLTLTATPIPRTLYMSLTGARDMSLLQTPPRERVPIETLVERNDDEVLRNAILRELDRDGQVFYLYNRIATIDLAFARVRKLVPHATVAVGHGQMSAGELSSIMRRFAAGEVQVLISTTIVESGVDIPRANTIVIDRADRFGIAELYQLRGRVGRSRHKGYAYLLLPRHGMVESEARQRIAALRRFSDLGAGFNLAMKDLEIRGAGNLLGPQQSGSIAAVGFGLYCQMLRRTVAKLKGERLPPLIDVTLKLDFIDLAPRPEHDAQAASIPYTYIDHERLRLSTYRRLAELTTVEDTAALRAELADRFGAPPPAVERLFQLARLRIAAHEAKVTSLETKDDKVLAMRNGAPFSLDGRLPRLREGKTDRRLDELLAIVSAIRAEEGSATALRRRSTSKSRPV